MGVAGSGKTTLSREIVRRVCAVYIDNNHIADAFSPHTRDGRRYQRMRPHFYKALYAITEENLKVGNSVLLDVPHVKEMQLPAWRASVRGLITRTGVKLIVIRCCCSEMSLYQRILSRCEPRDRWKLTHWQEFLSKEPIDVPIPFPHLDVDTEQDVSRNIRKAVEYILG